MNCELQGDAGSSSEISMPSNNRGNSHLTYCSFKSNNWIIAPQYSYQASGNHYQLQYQQFKELETCPKSWITFSYTGEDAQRSAFYGNERGSHETCFLFDKEFKIMIPARESWNRDQKALLPENSRPVYTDGSGGPLGAGAGIYFGNLAEDQSIPCLLYTSPSPRDRQKSRMPSSA